MKTTVDWLKFRTRSNPFAVCEALRPLFGTAGDLLTFKTGLKGLDGWTSAGELSMAGDIALGRIDYGGESQREWVRVNLTGTGCEWVQDWAAAESLVDILVEAEIQRIDIALTTFDGEVSDARVVQAYQDGKFTNCGRPPSMRSITDTTPRAGTTRYIGKRDQHKFLRCYEKGLELLTKVPESWRLLVTEINGHAPESIYRVELELKNKDGKFIPWTVIGRRDDIFAGAYPFCAELLPGVPHWVLATMPTFEPKCALETALDHCRRAYGPTLRAALMAHDGDMEKVMQRVLSSEPSRALIEAGVLTCAHS